MTEKFENLEIGDLKPQKPKESQLPKHQDTEWKVREVVVEAHLSPIIHDQEITAFNLSSDLQASSRVTLELAGINSDFRMNFEAGDRIRIGLVKEGSPEDKAGKRNIIGGRGYESWDEFFNRTDRTSRTSYGHWDGQQ